MNISNKNKLTIIPILINIIIAILFEYLSANFGFNKYFLYFYIFIASISAILFAVYYSVFDEKMINPVFGKYSIVFFIIFFVIFLFSFDIKSSNTSFIKLLFFYLSFISFAESFYSMLKKFIVYYLSKLGDEKVLYLEKEFFDNDNETQSFNIIAYIVSFIIIMLLLLSIIFDYFDIENKKQDFLLFLFTFATPITSLSFLDYKKKCSIFKPEPYFFILFLLFFYFSYLLLEETNLVLPLLILFCNYCYFLEKANYYFFRTKLKNERK